MADITEKLIEQLNSRKTKASDVEDVKQRFISRAQNEKSNLEEEMGELQDIIDSITPLAGNPVADSVLERYGNRVSYRQEKVSKFDQISALTPENFEAEVQTIDPDYYNEFVTERDQELALVPNIDAVLEVLNPSSPAQA